MKTILSIKLWPYFQFHEDRSNKTVEIMPGELTSSPHTLYSCSTKNCRSKCLSCPSPFLSRKFHLHPWRIEGSHKPAIFHTAAEVSNSPCSRTSSRVSPWSSSKAPVFLSRVGDFVKYLWLLKNYKDNPLIKRLELWKKIMERLDYLFENMES